MAKNKFRLFTTVFVGFATVASCLSPAFAEQRTWTGRNGKQLDAELVKDEGDHIVLLGSDGKEYRTKTSNLSAPDFEFLKSIRESQRVELTPKQDPQLATPQGQTRITADLSSLYEIVSIEDLSYENVVRKSIRVRVSREFSEEELTAISRKIVRQFTSKEKIKAIRIFFFLPDSDTKGAFTAGKATWAPAGDWASASKNNSAKLVVEAGGVMGTVSNEYVVDMELAKKKHIYMQIVLFQDNGMNNEQSHAAVAQQFGISFEQAKKIGVEGSINGWELP